MARLFDEPEPRWPNILVGFLIAAALALAGERIYHTWKWAGQVNLQAQYSAAYLFQEVSGAKHADGTPIRRYEIIDAALQDYINRQQGTKAPVTK